MEKLISEYIITQKHYDGAKDSLLNDSAHSIFNPSKIRWFSSFEMSQFLRFMIALNWTKKHFESLDKEELKTFGKNKKHRYIADFGCSYSQFYNYWRSNCNYFGWPRLIYMGVEADYKRIMKGKSSFTPKKNDKILYYLADLTKTITLLHKADIIVCMETLEHIPKEKAPSLMANIRRNLKPSGIAILSSPNPRKDLGEEFAWGDNSRGGHVHEWSYDEAFKFFKKENFIVKEECGMLPRKSYAKHIIPLTKKVYARYFPTSLLNNIFCVTSNIDFCKQWMVTLKKKDHK